MVVYDSPWLFTSISFYNYFKLTEDSVVGLSEVITDSKLNAFKTLSIFVEYLLTKAPEKPDLLHVKRTSLSSVLNFISLYTLSFII